MYEGRALRVQLRDTNPPKGNWKFGRGRGRFLQHNFNSHRRYNYRPFNEPYNPTNVGGPGCSPETNDGLSAVASVSENQQQTRGSKSSTPSMGREAPGADKFHEWYDGLESPSPSSKGSSASVTCASYNTPPYPLIQNAPYMPPPWMQPYIPNPLPYYPGYTLYPPQPPPVVSHPSSDTNGPAVSPLAVWPSGVYGVSFVL